MQIQSLSWKDSLKKELATHSSILAWERIGHDWVIKQQQLTNEKIQKINALISFFQTTRIIVDQSKSCLLLEQENT